MKPGINFNELPLVCQDCDKLNCLSLFMNGTAWYTCGNPICLYRSDLYKVYEEENVEAVR